MYARPIIYINKDMIKLCAEYISVLKMNRVRTIITKKSLPAEKWHASTTFSVLSMPKIHIYMMISKNILVHYNFGQVNKIQTPFQRWAQHTSIFSI